MDSSKDAEGKLAAVLVLLFLMFMSHCGWSLETAMKSLDKFILLCMRIAWQVTPGALGVLVFLMAIDQSTCLFRNRLEERFPELVKKSLFFGVVAYVLLMSVSSIAGATLGIVFSRAPDFLIKMSQFLWIPAIAIACATFAVTCWFAGRVSGCPILISLFIFTVVECASTAYSLIWPARRLSGHSFWFWAIEQGVVLACGVIAALRSSSAGSKSFFQSK